MEVQVMKIVARAALPLVFALTSGFRISAAEAATMGTSPLYFSEANAYCAVSNVGTSARGIVSLKIQNARGAAVAATNCRGKLKIETACELFAYNLQGTHFCRLVIDGSSKAGLQGYFVNESNPSAWQELK